MARSACDGGRFDQQNRPAMNQSAIVHRPLSIVRARPDTSQVVMVERRLPLFYRDGADGNSDRPEHIRAASGLDWFAGQLAIIQDDANFIALLTPPDMVAQVITLPAGQDNRRQFDDQRGNKKWKLDLEACVTIPGRPERLLAFGSGSAPGRDQLVVVEATGPDFAITVYPLPAFYEQLRQNVPFAGRELNLEGVVWLPSGRLRFFQRGNGLPPATDASIEVNWAEFWAHVQRPADIPPPPLEKLITYDLGQLAGCRLTFTDATYHQGQLYFTATAEDSPDAVQDGPVVGSVLGRMETDGSARWWLLVDPAGNLFTDKVEGLVIDETNPRQGYLTIDPDDPGRASELCFITLPTT